MYFYTFILLIMFTNCVRNKSAYCVIQDGEKKLVTYPITIVNESVENTKIKREGKICNVSQLTLMDLYACLAYEHIYNNNWVYLFNSRC